MRTTTGVMRKWILWPPLPSTNWRRGWRNWSSSLWNWRKVGTNVLMRKLRCLLLILPWRQNLPHTGRDRMSLIIKHVSVVPVFRLFCSSISSRCNSPQISSDYTKKHRGELLALMFLHAGFLRSVNHRYSASPLVLFCWRCFPSYKSYLPGT